MLAPLPAAPASADEVSANLASVPGISFPCGFTRGKLPIIGVGGFLVLMTVYTLVVLWKPEWQPR